MNIRAILRQPVLTIAFYDEEVRWTLGRGASISGAGRVALPPGIVSDGVVVDAAALARSVRESEFPGNSRMQTVLALPAVRSVFRQMEIPHVQGKAFNEFALREIRRELPTVADHTYVNWRLAESSDGKARIFIIGVARDVLDSHLKAVEELGLTPVSADIRVIAAARAVGKPTVVVAQIEDQEVEIAVFTSGLPSIVRSVAMRAPCGEPDWTEELTQELNRALKFYRDSRRDDTGATAIPICVAGGAARVPGITAAIAQSTGHEVTFPTLTATLPGAADPLRFASNVGAAMKDLAA